jgi:hypothetical protein
MPKSEGKHEKTTIIILQKKRTLNPLEPDSYRDSQNFSITP